MPVATLVLDRAALHPCGAAGRHVSHCPAGPTGKPVAPAGGSRPPRWRDDRGANAIELAILLPVIVVLLLFGIQVSLYFLAQSEAESAVQAGVDAQRGYTPTDPTTAVQTYVGSSPNAWFSLSSPPLSTDKEAAGIVTITITGHSMSLLPGWAGWPISATATGPVEYLSGVGDP
jgi:Flp pilus assembly pilin Flp